MTPYCAVQRMRDEAVAARDPAAPAVPRSAASCQHPAYAEPLIKLPLAAAADLLPTKTPLRGGSHVWSARGPQDAGPKSKGRIRLEYLSEIRPDWLLGQDL